MTETYSLTLTPEQFETLVDCIERACEDFDYASRDSGNGYTDDDIESFWKSIKSLQAVVNASRSNAR